eukprot:5064065-Lingulodinium_polyedra.AAC.1
MEKNLNPGLSKVGIKDLAEMAKSLDPGLSKDGKSLLPAGGEVKLMGKFSCKSTALGAGCGEQPGLCRGTAHGGNAV